MWLGALSDGKFSVDLTAQKIEVPTHHTENQNYEGTWSRPYNPHLRHIISGSTHFPSPGLVPGRTALTDKPWQGSGSGDGTHSRTGQPDSPIRRSLIGDTQESENTSKILLEKHVATKANVNGLNLDCLSKHVISALLA